MVAEIQMPKLGATMEKGTIIEWFKNEGDSVELGEPILEIMTDKINMEVEAISSGILLKKLFEVDTEVPVLVPIAYIGELGENIAEKLVDQTKNETENNKSMVNEGGEIKSEKPSLQSTFIDSKIRRTPAALKLAQRHGLDLSKIKGSGPKNRIHQKDVELYMKDNSVPISPLAQKIVAEHNIDLSSRQSVHTKIQSEDVLKGISRTTSSSVNYNGIRKVVGERMAKSAHTAPHVTINTEVDMTNTMDMRNSLLEKIQSKTGYRLSYTEIIVKSVAHTIKSHPMLNASLNGNQIDLHSEINIGVAVAIPNGLVVPVIRNANQKGFSDLAVESKNLAKKVRENKINADELQGGTFTISNLGMYDVDSFTPIINQPESAILGVGRIREQVVSHNGAIEVRPYMSLSLSFDHRVIDGAPAAHFLTDLKAVLEKPYELMI
ncbi:dihydrolipoamide acetyltransferase family protein [Bacillus massiliigorillae]|uniref:dihydrolipoamide acetyltransferase family protein n=1 Tax=Bacillus massiliigorillae TaxID=1243664 RepID=UPI0003A5600A|nr:dihydrolipoamide acetyltransferase family protein [Bacillus massiliigorillae]